MTSRLVAVTFQVEDPAPPAAFWGALLDRPTVEEPDGVLLPGDATQVGLRFVTAGVPKSGLNRVHLHVTSSSPDDQRRTVETALRLGGRQIDIGQRPEEGHVVLADPGDDELCVIEPGNRFLAGCGFLGEVACEGSRAVGLFWRDALGWPLVWDEDGETAVQSPAGGTKVAWSGQPPEPGPWADRQRLDLATTDVGAEVARLVALGATRRDGQEVDGGVELADPDGVAFRLTQG
ncbi:VOC family protein [Actinotalea ferrariae]|uniref:VOC family protein n=1 Tax=Actinotalea ferrariae TaxID=1386098 RepID=UPI0027DEC0EE|nr:VOC family protein [Actinotalea ferrariae]